ncbi:MAG: hypothetical protein Q9217_004372 [Psora testacea]
MQLQLSSSRILLAVQWISAVSAGVSRLIPRASTPSPISIPPSQHWDGNDGPWSSFTLQVGTPVQNVRVSISAASPNTWVVRSDGCLSSDNSCFESRGRTFNPNSSTTWEQQGSYQLGFDQSLGLNVPGVFGNDTLGLGIQGSGGPMLEDQIIAAYTSQDLYLGMFGLNPSSTNFSATDQGRPSYMSTLKSQNLIPSLSFGYTAGNQYRLKKVYGSLTLGGYDSSLFMQNSLTVPFAEDAVRNLLVGIQSISAKAQNGTTSNLLPTPITANVDSTIPMIWLPTEACQAFERAFGLTWDEETDLYLVNDELHDALQKQNASVTFTLGAGTSGGQTADIVLPYDSFDLLIQPPFDGISQGQRYFPLRRASGDQQFTLGRTFLQEAYLTVDWERRNFSISQCVFSETATQNLVPISSVSSSSSGLSSSAKIGIAVGVVAAAVVLGLATFFILRRRKVRHAAAAAADKSEENPGGVIRQGFVKEELGTGFDNTRFEMEGSHGNASKPYGGKEADWVDEKARYPGIRPNLAEVEGGEGRAEMAAAGGGFYGGRGIHEMYDPSSIPPVELPTESPRGEMEGSTPASSPRRSGIPKSPFSNPLSSLSSTPSSNSSPILHKGSRRSRSSFFSSFSRGGNRSSGLSAPSLPSQPSTSAEPGSPAISPDRNRTARPPAPNPELFSPVSRKETFSPAPTKGGQDPEGVLSPISPVSLPTGKGVFGRFRHS